MNKTSQFGQISTASCKRTRKFSRIFSQVVDVAELRQPDSAFLQRSQIAKSREYYQTTDPFSDFDGLMPKTCVSLHFTDLPFAKPLQVIAHLAHYVSGLKRGFRRLGKRLIDTQLGH